MKKNHDLVRDLYNLLPDHGLDRWKVIQDKLHGNRYITENVIEDNLNNKEKNWLEAAARYLQTFKDEDDEKNEEQKKEGI